MIEDKLDSVMNWADENPQFEPSFIESLAIQFQENGDLSDKQVLALDNIIDKWGIE